MQPSKKLPNTG